MRDRPFCDCPFLAAGVVFILVAACFAAFIAPGALFAQTPPEGGTTNAPNEPPSRAIGVVAVGGQDLAIGKFHFLGIGIDEYQKRELNLQTAVAGARELESLLIKEFTFDREDCRLLLDAEATRAGIIAALRRLAQTAAPEDSVLIYYAGHGNLDSLTGKGSWIPWDATSQTPDRWIGNDEIKTLLGAMKTRHALLVSDSCFAGDFFRAEGREGVLAAINDANVRRAFGLLSRRAMTAGGVQPVADGGRDGQSIYTWWLLTALRENPSPYVLPEEVHDRIKKAVSANAPQQPMYGLLQGTGGEPEGSFVFFRRGTAGLDAAMKEKMERIAKMQEMDRESAEKARRQQEEILAKQNQLNDLDKRLAELQANLGAGAGQSGLDAMLAMVREKDRKGKELEALRKKAEEELKAREAALEAARRQQEAERAKLFQEEFAKYQEINASPYASEDFKTLAWNTLSVAWNIPADAPRDKPLAYAGGKIVVGTGVLPVGAPGKTSVVDLGGGVRLEMVYLEGGSFQMGSPRGGFLGRGGESGRDNDEGPVHTVELDGFWIGKYEVTQEQYQAIMGTNPSNFRGAKNPVEKVSWYDATEFCRKLNDIVVQASLPAFRGRTFRLPTEAEWEYACRAGSRTRFCFGDSDSGLGSYAWYGGNSGGRTHPVGQKQPNAWGLYDMHGNVWEWCSDWKADKYGGGTEKNPVGASSGQYRVLRGGSWGHDPRLCRSANRDGNLPTDALDVIGFRVVSFSGGL